MTGASGALSSSRLLVAVALSATAIWLFPIRAEIGGGPGLAYWTVLALISSAMPVRLPQGTVATVSAAPILASVILGGPTAAMIVGGIGTVESREVRGEVPWYGTLYNHASTISTAAAAGIAYELGAPADPSNEQFVPILEFLAILVASAIAFAVNWTFSSFAVAARTGVSVRTVWARDLRGHRGQPHRPSPCGVADGAGLLAPEWRGLVGNDPLLRPPLHDPHWPTTATSKLGSCSSRRSAPWPTRWTLAIGIPVVIRTG